MKKYLVRILILAAIVAAIVALFRFTPVGEWLNLKNLEQNRDAQLRSLLMIELEIPAEKLIPVLHYNGMPIPSVCVVDAVREHVREEVAA